MNLKDIIAIIPNLFLYFIPGYITIYIHRYFSNSKEQKESHWVILSIVVSFIIQTIFKLLTKIISIIFSVKFIQTQNEENLFLLLLSVVVAYFLVIYKDSKAEKYVNKIFHSNTKSEPSVWNHAMKAEYGAWAKVYLFNENRVYVGKLINYTIDPEDNNKEILLSSFSSYLLDSEEEVDNYDDDNKLVLIKCSDIKCIEVIKD